MIQKFKSASPRVAASAYLHQTSVVIGDVDIAANVSVWPMAVIRGDVAAVSIGENSNVQDCCVIHVNENAPCIIGRDVTIGHGAVVHGAKVGDRCLIGMKAVVMESEIGEDCLVAAGAVVNPGKKIPPRSLVMGVPAKIMRQLSPEELAQLRRANTAYLELAAAFKEAGHDG
ncbi:MAG: gamma carbonic anhydrase family protein [Elusimicrobiales bacterium]